MENYETLMDELTRLNIQKQAVMKQMREIEEQLNAVKKERAEALFGEIFDRISELKSLGFRFEAEIFDNDCGYYDWVDITDYNLRYRHKDEIIVG